MSVIDDISTSALQQLEELDPAAPVFWNLAHEIRPLVLEAMCEATLICGEPQTRLSASPYTIPANTTFLQNPVNSFAILRVELNGLPLHKVSIFDMDMENTQWQNDPPSDVPRDWFPLGLGQWGIHPQVVAPVQAILTVLSFPVSDFPPYDGTEVIGLPIEYDLGLEAYVNAWARLKEGGQELQQGMGSYELFLSTMEELSNFALRKGSLRFTRTLGAVSEVDPIQKR